MSTPKIEALDSNGFPYVRNARTCGELPTTQERRDFLKEITPYIAEAVGVPCPSEKIKFGIPVWASLGFVCKRQFRDNTELKLLMTKGADIPLSTLRKLKRGAR